MKLVALAMMAVVSFVSMASKADLDSEITSRSAEKGKASTAAYWKRINTENRQIAISILGRSVIKTENDHTMCFVREGGIYDGWDFRSILAKMRDGRICLIDNCSGYPKLIYCE